MTKNQNKEITKGWSSVSRPIIVTIIVIVIMVITIKPFFNLRIKERLSCNNPSSLIKMTNANTPSL